MKKYSEAKYSSSKRFCKPHRMMLVQGDIKYGPMLPIGKGGKPTQIYLSVLIDDRTRMILSFGWYDNQEGIIVENTFRKAILQYGKPDVFCFDNGSQYVSKELRDALSRLGIRILHCKPYSAQSKGKVERQNQSLEAFLREAKAKGVTTLEEMNRQWQMWVIEYYHNKKHEGLEEYYKSQGWELPPNGTTPQQEWDRDSRRLTFLDTSLVAEAFLHHTTRVVDKGGCLSFGGRMYEVSAALIGAKVNVSYDPMAPETLTVRYAEMTPMTVHPVVIGEYCASRGASDLPLAGCDRAEAYGTTATAS